MKGLKITLILVMALFAGCRNKPAVTDKEEVTRVKTVPVRVEKVSIPVHSGGIVSTSEEVKLSFKAGGIVSGILVREGERVKRGVVLAKLNLSEIEENVNIAAKAYDKALRDWNRAKNLYTDTVATLEQFQNATTALDVAKSTLEIARFNLRHSTITAPGNGLILKQLIRENELVAAGYPVFLFGLTGESWKVKTGLSDRDVVRINVGDSANITLDAYPGRVFKGEVTQISSIASPGTGTYEVELSLADDGLRLAAGFIAGVSIYTSGVVSSSVVPVGSLVDASADYGYLYYVNGTSNAIRVRVAVESLAGSQVAVSGIPEGVTEVVSEGASYLRDGMKVEVVK